METIKKLETIKENDKTITVMDIAGQDVRLSVTNNDKYFVHGGIIYRTDREIKKMWKAIREAA